MQQSSLITSERQGNLNMPETRIVLDQQMLEEMQSHSVSTYPEECCGLMFGKVTDDGLSKKVQRLRRMKNTFQPSERYHRYTIDPKEFLNAEKEAEEREEEIVGVYHSHPNAPAKPSEFDRGHAWPTLSYVVVEVRGGKVIETKSWILKEDRTEFLPEELRIVVK
jgi:proteasome lid subunit RPN8/RPN11